MLQIWRVVVARPLDDEARTRLADAGMLHFATTTGNDGMTRSSVYLDAQDEQHAKTRVVDALGAVPIIQADRAPISAHIPITDDLRPHFEKSAESDFHSLRVVESEETGLES